MSIPNNCRYTKDHEWIRVEGSIAIVGVTEFAQSELGEIVFLELPNVDASVSAGGAFCVLESTKAASDVYAPINGTVSEINEAAKSDPTIVNRDPHGEGWLAKLSGFDAGAVEKLLSADEYKAHIGG